MDDITATADYTDETTDMPNIQEARHDILPEVRNSENGSVINRSEAGGELPEIPVKKDDTSIDKKVTLSSDNYEFKSNEPESSNLNAEACITKTKPGEQEINRGQTCEAVKELCETSALHNEMKETSSHCDVNTATVEVEDAVGAEKKTAIQLTYYQNTSKYSDIMKILKDQREKGRYCDVIFSFEKEQIYAHSCVLAANSPYFDMQLEEEYSETSLKRMLSLTFPTTDIQIAEYFIHYMYTSSLGISTEIVDELIRVADRLGMVDVIQYCSEHLVKNLNINNWLEVKSLAVQYQLESVITSVRIFLTNHLPEVMCTTGFLELNKEDILSTLGNCNSNESRRMEAKILNAVLTWVCHRYEERMEVYSELLTLLHPELLNAKSVSAMLDLARFQHTGIATTDVSVDFVGKVSNRNSINIEDILEADDDNNDEVVEESDDEYKPYSSSSRKRPRKLMAPQRVHQGEWYYPQKNKRGRPRKEATIANKRKPRGRPRKNILKEHFMLKKRATELTKEDLKKETNGEQSVETSAEHTRHEESGGCGFKNWSLTTTDMDINIDEEQVQDALAGDVTATLSPGKKRDILKCSLPECTYETLYQKKLEHHREWHAGVRQHVCEVCGDAFSNDKHLTRHSKLHTGYGKKYDCQWCPYSSLRSDKLRDHIKNRHQRVALKLGLYEKGARGRHTKYQLDQQQEIKDEAIVGTGEENDAKRKEEDVQKKEGETSDTEIDIDPDKVKQLAMYGIVPKKPRKLDFSSMSRRSRTKRLVGKKNGIPVAPLLENVQSSPKKPRGRPPAIVTGEKVSCPKCPKEFMTVNQMKHHLRGHGSDQPMLCEVCGFTTRHYCAMKLHMNVHAGDVLKCTWEGCDYQTARRPLMRDHMNRHEGIKNHVCSVCGKAFTARKHMHRHEKTHAEIKPIACPVCPEFRTTRNDKLREHLRVHHVEKAVAMGYMTEAEMQKKMEKKMTIEASKPCVCSHCPFRTTNEAKLMDHMKKKHHEIAISMGVMSEQEWCELQVGNASNKEKKLPRKRKKEPSAKSVITEPVSKLEGAKPEPKSVEEAPLPGNYLVQTTRSVCQTQQRTLCAKEEARSPVSISSHHELSTPVTRPVENSAQLQPVQTSQSLPLQAPPVQPIQPSHHSIYHPSGQVVTISQNHSIAHHHHHTHHPGSTGTATQVVTHHQPGTDLVPPYIASVMIEGVPVQLPPEMQAQLQNHWPYQ